VIVIALEQPLQCAAELACIAGSHILHGDDKHKLTEEQLTLLMNWCKLSDEKKRLIGELIALG
jgi:hypothetical protein